MLKKNYAVLFLIEISKKKISIFLQVPSSPSDVTSRKLEIGENVLIEGPVLNKNAKFHMDPTTESTT